MATYTGLKAPAYIESTLNPNSTSNLDGIVRPRWTEVSLTGEGGSGKPTTLIHNAPVSQLGNVHPGVKACSFADDFYNRIYFIPGSIDFGAVTNDTSRPLRVWNAFLTTVSITNIGVDNPEGIEMSGPSAPSSMGALGSWEYSVEAFVDGPATINTTFNFTFDTGQGTYSLKVTGSRAQLWPFVPNWRSPYLINYEYRTEILESHSGKQQRRAMRQNPRKTMEHTVLIRNKDQLRKFNRLMTQWQHRTWVMPERTRSVTANTGMPSGGATVGVSEAVEWIVEGATVVLEANDKLEMRLVESITGNQLSFSTSTETVWPAGTRIYPGLTGNLDEVIDAPRDTNSVAQVRVSFIVNPGSEISIEPPEPELTLRGREVVLTRPNWINGLSSSTEHPFDTVDYGWGIVHRETPIPFGTEVKQMTFTQRNRTEAENLRHLFDRLKGQQGEFYMPTWESDMDIAQGVSVGTNALRIKGLDLYNYYRNDTVHKAITVFMKNGDIFVRYINSIVRVDDQSGSDSLLALDQQWDYNFEPSEVKMVSWTPVWRLGSDALSIEWLTDRVAQSQLVTRTLEDLEPEL